MTLPVSLKAVVDEMDVPSDQLYAYLNKNTGELVTIGDEEIEIVETGDSPEHSPDWQQEAIQKTREVLSSGEYLPLPTKFEIHEYAIMERFCLSLKGEALREELLNKIRGAGAFGRFQATIRRRGVLDDWYAFRQIALERIVVDWLESQNIPYQVGHE